MCTFRKHSKGGGSTRKIGKILSYRDERIRSTRGIDKDNLISVEVNDDSLIRPIKVQISNRNVDQSVGTTNSKNLKNLIYVSYIKDTKK